MVISDVPERYRLWRYWFWSFLNYRSSVFVPIFRINLVSGTAILCFLQYELVNRKGRPGRSCHIRFDRFIVKWVNLIPDALVTGCSTESVELVRPGTAVLQDDDLYRGFWHDRDWALETVGTVGMVSVDRLISEMRTEVWFSKNELNKLLNTLCGVLIGKLISARPGS